MSNKPNKGVQFLKDTKRVQYGVKKKSTSKSSKKSRLKKLPQSEDRFTKSLSLFQSDMDLISKIDLELRTNDMQLNTSQILRLCLQQFEFDEYNTNKISNSILDHYRRHKKESSIKRRKRFLRGKSY